MPISSKNDRAESQYVSRGFFWRQTIWGSSSLSMVFLDMRSSAILRQRSRSVCSSDDWAQAGASALSHSQCTSATSLSDGCSSILSASTGCSSDRTASASCSSVLVLSVCTTAGPFSFSSDSTSASAGSSSAIGSCISASVSATLSTS